MSRAMPLMFTSHPFIMSMLALGQDMEDSAHAADLTRNCQKIVD